VAIDGRLARVEVALMPRRERARAASIRSAVCLRNGGER